MHDMTDELFFSYIGTNFTYIFEHMFVLAFFHKNTYCTLHTRITCINIGSIDIYKNSFCYTVLPMKHKIFL